MADINKLLGSLLSSGAATGFAGGVAGSMLTSKSGQKMGKKALKLGGVAAVGALAYTAYNRYNKSQSVAATAASETHTAAITPAPQGSAFMPEQRDKLANDTLGLVLVRAMIAASRADGKMDAQESQVIFQKIEALGLDGDDQALMVAEMSHPVDMDSIVNSSTGPEVSAEIYTASLLAVDVDNSSEKSYLAMLAARLQIPARLVTEIEKQVASQKALV